MEDKNFLVEVTADIVSSYVSKNKIAVGEIPTLIASVHNSLEKLSNKENGSIQIEQTPAVPVNRSVGENYLTCLEDGLQFKSLKRHLKSHHNLTPEQYRGKWGLAPDYPMVAPSYSLKRSKLAKENGLGKVATD